MRVISGKKRGLKLKSIPDSNVRPTLDRIKENLFNIIGQEIQDKIFLDFFGGFGGIGIEAYSRGAKVYISEISKENFKVISENLDKLNASEIKAYNLDYTELLNKLINLNIKADYIYLDPPYIFTKEKYEEIIFNIISKDILKEDGIIIVETEKKLDSINEFSEEIREKINIIDHRKYGRNSLIFIQKKG